MFTTLLQAQTAPGGGGSSLSMIVMMVVLFAIFYFFMIRPQNKKQKELMNFRNSLTVGQEVITVSGIYGTVKSIDEANGSVMLEISKGVQIKIAKEGVNPLATKK
ncbi:MAG: preprotein translocase subunit YajC [Alloprevotella sp.]